MKEPFETNHAVTARLGRFRFAVPAGTRRAQASLLGSFVLLGTCAGSLMLSGCGGGSSSAPSVSSANSLRGIYMMSVNRTSSGTVADASLPTGTGTLQATDSNTLDPQFNLVDATRSPDPSQVVSTVARYGDMTGTFSSDGSFDLRGTVRDYTTTNGVASLITTGQTVRLQGRLPGRNGTTVVTVTVGTKTTTGTILFSTDLPTPTPTATATPAVE